MCVSEDAYVLTPLKGFWFALDASLIYQDKQYMKKRVAYSFQSGNVFLML